MSTHSSSSSLYFLTISIQPQKEGVDVPYLIGKISDLFEKSTSTKLIHTFKVTCEAKVIIIIQVSNIIALERTIACLWKLGPIDVDCQPIIFYESFAQNMKIADVLCTPSSCDLHKQPVYWLEFNIEYHGQSFDDFLAIWKNEAETVLTLRSKGESNIELFKCLAQRKVHVLLNAADTTQLDHLSLQLPLMKDNGANILIKTKGVQFLGEYLSQISNNKQ
uniref:Uncharacterized protein n=1 Tax=Arion vulgaris TaxID=1028688 RepID=A0A0B7BCQ4_9EUPU